MLRFFLNNMYKSFKSHQLELQELHADLHLHQVQMGSTRNSDLNETLEGS
uniref:Uncharacterized protein n=1 Tax=Rhizophora mucronata TaxID=61149 RepID=A0A2P2K8H2_RHIMU